jgi:hypothetical protein
MTTWLFSILAIVLSCASIGMSAWTFRILRQTARLWKQAAQIQKRNDEAQP